MLNFSQALNTAQREGLQVLLNALTTILAEPAGTPSQRRVFCDTISHPLFWQTRWRRSPSTHIRSRAKSDSRHYPAEFPRTGGDDTKRFCTTSEDIYHSIPTPDACTIIPLFGGYWFILVGEPSRGRTGCSFVSRIREVRNHLLHPIHSCMLTHDTGGG